MQKKQHTKNTNKVFFLTGGGTGGHIYPCVSILNELKNRGENNIFYVGNSKNSEYSVTAPLGIEFLDVPVFGMPRKISLKFIKWMILLFVSILKCIYYAFKFKPDVVFATGGYVSAPMVIVSKILKIPYVMHDSDAHPGIVTRAFSNGAKYVNLAFLEGNKFIKAKNITNHKNPVRNEFFAFSKDEARDIMGIKDEFCVLIMGGSQGAKTINNAAIGLIGKYLNNKNVKIIFQTGKKNYADVKEYIKNKLGLDFDNDGNVAGYNNFIIRPYFEKMYLPILASDIVVSRAGSLSISEILAAKKPSILVPYPYAAADHQRKNAKEVEKTGSAVYVEDNDLNSEILGKILDDFMQDEIALHVMSENAGRQIMENPTYKILDLILDAAS